MTILCELDDKTAGAVVHQLGGVIRRAANLPEAAILLTGRPEERLLVIGAAAPLNQVLDFTHELRADRPDVSVLLIRHPHEPDAVEAALQAGVREVVAAGDVARLAEACRRLLATPVPNVVPVASDRPSVAVEPAAPPVSVEPAEPPEDDGIDLFDQEADAPAVEDASPVVAVETSAPEPLSAPVPNVPAAPVADVPAPPDPAAVFQPVAPLGPPAGPLVITVFSPKGGSGKTTIATNLAVALSETGRNVCLVDLDLEFGDVAISLRLTPVRTLVDAVTTDADGDADDALQLLTTQYKPGLDCILAPIEPGDAGRIPPELVSDLIALLRERYAYVVIDTPSQFSEHVLAALDASDLHVLLTNPEIPALKNLRLTLDMLDLLHYPHHRRAVVFNRADDASGLSEADVHNAIHTPIAANVPASRDVPASINSGVPIVAAKPKHPVSVAIREFAAERIVGAPVSQAQSARRKSIFRRRSE